MISRQSRESNSVGSGFPGPDADSVFDLRDEYFSVSDPSRLRGFPDRIGSENGGGAGNDHFDFHLGKEIDDIFRPAIEFGVALLPAEAFHFRDGDTGDACFAQCLLHFVELERLDNRLDFLHWHVFWTFLSLRPGK